MSRPIAATAAFVLALPLLAAFASAQPETQPSAVPPCPYPGSPTYPGLPGVCHPYPQPPLPASVQTHFCGDSSSSVASCVDCPAGEVCRTKSDTGESYFPKSNPFDYTTFPGTNFLPSVFTNNFDSGGVEMPQTLPSTPRIPYNLHLTDPQVYEINPTSPEQDLEAVFDGIAADVAEMDGLRRDPERTAASLVSEIDLIQEGLLRRASFGIDVLEGNPVENRAYSGFPLLHYTGPEKVKKVEPIHDAAGKLIGGNVNVHQVWYGQRIESDTALLDPSEVLGVPWTVTYTVDVLHRGHDDFSPFVTYTDTPRYDTTTGKPCPYGFDDPKRETDCALLPAWFDDKTGKPCPYPDDPERSVNCTKKGGPPPNVGMDQSFFNMEDGTRTVFGIGMAPGDYLNLVYTWGWRNHPPRIQVMEKAVKKIANPFPGGSDGLCPQEYGGCALPQLEQAVFCNPEDPATPKISSGDPLPGGGTNTCSVPNLPACTSTRCAPGDVNPQCEKNKLYAIGKIGELAPAKRMWTVLRNEILVTARAAHQAWLDWPGHGEWQECVDQGGDDCDEILRPLLEDPDLWNPWAQVAALVADRGLPAYYAFTDRTELPCYRRDESRPRPFNCVDGLNPVPGTDINTLFVNNTTYGELTRGGWVRWNSWQTRYEAGEDPEVNDAVLNVAAFNGDHFPHSYVIADFGGARGWENQFKSSVKVAGSGCWFTFGRAYWWLNTGGPNGFLCIPPAQPDPSSPYGVLGERRFDVQFNFEPSRRLRFYQFDPFHHDVAIYSVH